MIIKTLIVSEGKINAAIATSFNSQSQAADCCFELFGFDVLIDDLFQVWLMEVNFAPSLTADSALDYQIKSKVLTDMLNLIGLKKSAQNTINSTNTSVNSSVLKKRMPYTNGIANNNIAANTTEESLTFHFHGDFEHRHQYATMVHQELEENNEINHSQSFEQQMLKLVWAQFKEELSQPAEKKIVFNYLQERQRSMQNNNQFHLIYPKHENYSEYQKFFSVDRISNELLGRFVFFLHHYSQLNSPQSSSQEENAKKSVKFKTSTKKKKSALDMSKMKKKLLMHTVYSQQYAGLHHPSNIGTGTSTKTEVEASVGAQRPRSAMKASSGPNNPYSDAIQNQNIQESRSNHNSRYSTPRRPTSKSPYDITEDDEEAEADDEGKEGNNTEDNKEVEDTKVYEFQVEHWNQIHNRWARAMGRSTAHNRVAKPS